VSFLFDVLVTVPLFLRIMISHFPICRVTFPDTSSYQTAIFFFLSSFKREELRMPETFFNVLLFSCDKLLYARLSSISYWQTSLDDLFSVVYPFLLLPDTYPSSVTCLSLFLFFYWHLVILTSYFFATTYPSCIYFFIHYLTLPKRHVYVLSTLSSESSDGYSHHVLISIDLFVIFSNEYCHFFSFLLFHS
jgi:hypothetical protein